MEKKKIKAKLNRMLNNLCHKASSSCGHDEGLALEFRYQEKVVDFMMSEIEWRDNQINSKPSVQQ